MSEEKDKLEPTSEQETPAKRRIRSFVLRLGRMTKGQQRAWDKNWPKFGLEANQGQLNYPTLFSRQAPTVLEIGFGMGQSLAKMAEQHPEYNFIGVEVHKPGVGCLLKEVEQHNLTNVRVFCDDAVEVFEHAIPDASLDRIQVFFPDPWHKKRHNKRRLIQLPFAQTLAKKLKAQGKLHLATDWEHYAEHMVDVLDQCNSLKNTSAEGFYLPRPAYRPETKFERRGHNLGHGVWDLIYEKI